MARSTLVQLVNKDFDMVSESDLKRLHNDLQEELEVKNTKTHLFKHISKTLDQSMETVDEYDKAKSEFLDKLHEAYERIVSESN